MVWLGVVLERTLVDEVDRAALRDGAAEAMTISDASIEPFLSGDPLGDGLTQAERDDLARSTSALVGNGTVVQLRLRDLDGAVVFDAADPGIRLPAPAQPDDEVDEAIAAGSTVRRTTMGADSVDGASPKGIDAIEAYVAVHDASMERVVAVAEVYIPYGPIAAMRNSSLARLRTVLIVGLSALWVLLATMVWSVGRRLRRSS
ncbi:MAG: hypothetical protein KDB06_05255, partial [Ilumatobacter sp.]|nr:hypothetical protein [Ilumatobacter sp.]